MLKNVVILDVISISISFIIRAIAGVVALAAGLAFGTASLDAASLPLPVLLLIGSAAGWVSAIGGAWTLSVNREF